ncbi:MAG: Rne/Rng family ribonuclease [Jatrophihabitantaceae bacterium]
MLDNTEPTDESTDASEPAGAPAKKAARKAAAKAPAKRAPRKTAAKKAPVDPTVPSAAAAGPGLVVDPGAGDLIAPAVGGSRATAAPVEAAPLSEATPPTEASTATPPKKASRARKAPAKKATGRADATAPDGTVEPADTDATAGPTPTQPASEPAVAEPAAGQPTAGPAKRTPRKRVSKAAAAAAAAAEQAAAEQAATGSTVEAPAQETLPAAPALAAPAVLFQPPVEAVAPPRRRRGGQRAQVEPVLDPETAELLDEAPEFSDVDADLEPEVVDELVAGETEADEDAGDGSRRRRRRGRRGRGSRSDADSAGTDAGGDADPAADLEDEDETVEDHADEVAEAALSASARRRRRRRRSSGADGAEGALAEDDPPNTVVHVRDSRSAGRESRGSAADDDGVRGVKGSTRLEAKRQRRRDNRDTGRRRAPILTEAEFLARRESVDRVMAVRQAGDRTQIAVLEDDILVEHYVTRASASSAVGNVYLGRVQNVLPSMEAAFVDIGRGRNGVLYAGEVNWDVAGLEGKSRSIENALNAGDMVLVQVTKDPIGHKGARLTSQISLPGRFVVYVPGGGMTGISRKLPDVERSRLKSILKKVVPDEAGVIVRTAAEGASEQDLISDVERLKSEWESISAKSAKARQSSEGPSLLHGEPDLAIRVVRDIFNDDFKKLVVAGSETHRAISDYVRDIAPDLADRISFHTSDSDLFRELRVDEQLAKALDRKVWLPSGGSLVIDRTEAMTVVDVNTGKYTGSGGNLEQTVTRNNLEAAEEIVRQLRLRDIGGIVVIDFIDMVLESNRDLVLRRLTECLGRDRTKHQVAEVTSLGLVQMTRKRVGEGLLEAFSEPCSTCNGRGVVVHLDAMERKAGSNGSSASTAAVAADEDRPSRGRRSRKAKAEQPAIPQPDPAEIAAEAEKRRAAANAVAAIAAATAHHEDVAVSRAADGEPAQRAGAAAEPMSAEPVATTAPAGVAEAAGTAEPASVAEPAARTAPRRRRGTSATRSPATAEREATQPDAQPSAAPPVTPQPSTAPPVTAQSSTAQPVSRQSSATQPDTAQSSAAPPARPRRRRAASRPAGPPVPLSVSEG